VAVSVFIGYSINGVVLAIDADND